MRQGFYCLNPYHYGNQPNLVTEDIMDSHVCKKKVRVQITGNAYKLVCRICRKVFNDKEEEEPIEIVTDDPGDLENVTIEDLDNEFEDMLNNIEDQVIFYFSFIVHYWYITVLSLFCEKKLVKLTAERKYTIGQ